MSIGKKIKDKNNEEKIIGIQSKVFIAKNRVSAPFKETTLDIYFDRGVDAHSGICEVLVEDGTLKEEDGNKFTYGKETIRGFKFKEWIAEHPELLV